jgi:hypothetical protein
MEASVQSRVGLVTAWGVDAPPGHHHLGTIPTALTHQERLMGWPVVFVLGPDAGIVFTSRGQINAAFRGLTFCAKLCKPFRFLYLMIQYQQNKSKAALPPC